MEQKTHKTLYNTHSWIGIISGILLFIVTFSGIPALFDHEIEYWQYPEYSEQRNTLLSPAESNSESNQTAQIFDLEKTILQTNTLEFSYEKFFIQPSSELNNHIVLAHFDKKKEADLRYLNATNYQKFPESPSELNHLLAHLHTDLHLPKPWGRYLVGLAGMAMLLAIIAGIFIHLKWRKEFVTLRPKRSWRLLLTDQHKLLGLWSLPFTLILAFTGTILGLLGLISPILALAAFNGDVEKATIAVLGPRAEITGEYTPAYPLNNLLERLEIDLPNTSLKLIQIDGLNSQGDELLADIGGIIKFSGYHKNKLSNLETVTYSLSSGEMLHQGSFIGKGVFQRIFAAVTPLHYVLFGNTWLKVFYAIAAMAACGLILTGNILWLYRRGHGMEHWLSKTTLGICGGLVVATSMSFAASQILYGFSLPVGSGLHHLVEEWVFWGSWGLIILAPFIITNGFKLSHYCLRLASLGFLATVIADGFINGRWVWHTEDWIFAIQISLLITAAIFLYLDWKMPNKVSQKKAARS